jgi:aspartyl-tRNA(Asn)/glutamyl-tRNA(Gln) amidotransferase subunit C
MISKDDVKKLATLSRIAVSENELESVAKEIDAILAYVGQINTASASLDGEVSYPLVNVLREDTEVNETGACTDDLLRSAPAREGDYVKVKKILG